MKRFYRTATAEPCGDGFAVLLDGRPARTPLRAPLTVPGRLLAEALAAEWRAQTDRIDPLRMPLTRIACAALDHAAPRRAAMIDGLVAYGETDLVCYRAERPQTLVARQEAVWGPILAWAAARHGVRLRVVSGVAPVGQPAQALSALRAGLEAFDAFRLAGVSAAVETLGSLLIALALADGRLRADDAFAAARIDEDHQAERWGEDAEAALRTVAMREELRAAERFLALSRE